MRTWKQIHAAYDRFRERYYLDAEPPLRVPPKAAQVPRWSWMANNSALAWSHFDEDSDIFHIELHPKMRSMPCFMRLTLLHELSHIRNPQANCTPRDRYWKQETVRLARLGAFVREQVF